MSSAGGFIGPGTCTSDGHLVLVMVSGETGGEWLLLFSGISLSFPVKEVLIKLYLVER